MYLVESGAIIAPGRMESALCLEFFDAITSRSFTVHCAVQHLDHRGFQYVNFNSKVKFPRFACATEERNGLLAGLQSMQFKHNDHGKVGKCCPESGVRESRDLLTYRVICIVTSTFSKPKQHSRILG